MSRPAQAAGERDSRLDDIEVLRSLADFDLDPFCRALSSLYDTPIALVTLIDDTSLWIKAHHGLSRQVLARDAAFCSETLAQGRTGALVIHDLQRHERFRTSPLVIGEPHMRFYAGAPIEMRPGQAIGTLCLIDTASRPDFDLTRSRALEDLADCVAGHLRLLKAGLDRAKDERHFRLLAENTTDVITWNDLDSRRRYVSPAAKTVFGYDPDELIGTKPASFIHPDDVEHFHGTVLDLASGHREKAVTTQRYRHKDGHFVWIEASFSLTRDGDGQPDGCVVSLRDISDRKAIEDELRISEERLALAVDSGSDGLWDWNIEARTVSMTGRWTALLGYGEGDIGPGIDAWQDLVHPDDAVRASEVIKAHLKGATRRFESDYRVRTKAGGYVWTSARGKVVARDAEGRALRMVGTHLDVTQRKEIERQLAHMALHDGLTGLANRTLFRERLDQEMSRRGRHQFAVIALDLDRFKFINDTLGHAAGDLFLRTIAERMKPVLRGGDLIARLGGDEFAIVLGQLSHRREARAIARRLIETIEQPLAVDGRLVSVSASLGIAMGPTDAQDPDQLFKNADIAMYQAKASGRSAIRFYEAGMDTAIAARNQLEQDLRDAVRSGGFSLHYQPVVALATRQVIGFEALMRWHHPRRGMVPPADFIPLAEQAGLIVSLGSWALKEACREAALWPNDLRIAVNVSALQFERPGLEQSVLSALASSGLAPDRLELEITESVLMHDAASVVACLRRLHQLGIRIALDDFGTGYSSLSYLRRFPFNAIKIDRSFVCEIDDPQTAAIVRAVVGLAVRAGAEVTAEGVETEAQMARVRDEGCSQAQGYFFSRPVIAEEARAMVAGVATAA